MIEAGLAPSFTLVGLSAAGIAAGLVLLVRGFGGYRSAARISGTATSRISSVAVGEVLVSGTAEPVELTLVSALQSRPCVYYRSRITEAGDGDGRDFLDEERAVGFRVRDSSGAVRVFPKGARFEVADRYDESTSMLAGSPTGLEPRSGSIYAPGPDDREAQIASLLTVRHAPAASVFDQTPGPLGGGSGRRRYREARIDPGDVVTILARVTPFADLDDPTEAFVAVGSDVGADDPEIAADLAAAREAGLLAATPDEAWGNASIEGFGIGRPVRSPVLDPAARRLPAADPELAARAKAAFEIEPDALVLVGTADVPMQIWLGAPAAAAARAEGRFVVGLLGAVLAIGSAMVLAISVSGSLG